MKSAKFYEIKVDNNTVTCYPSFCDFLCVVYCARVLNLFLVFEPTKKKEKEHGAGTTAAADSDSLVC